MIGNRWAETWIFWLSAQTRMAASKYLLAEQKIKRYGISGRLRRAAAGHGGIAAADALTCWRSVAIKMADWKFLLAAWMTKRCGTSGKQRPITAGADGLHWAVRSIY